jgi:hypothetical protein
MPRVQWTARERIAMRGYCTGPVDGVPAPGQVGLDLKALCCRCGKRVSVSVTGRYAHHKVPVANEVWIMSCGPILEGMSTDSKKVRKHVRLCFIGTKKEVMEELEDMRRKARFFDDSRSRHTKPKKRETVEIYTAGKVERHEV